jgi:phosphatidylethanolamine/phosphatidyl-N-methylethanolamine N-methyltransferase
MSFRGVYWPLSLLGEYMSSAPRDYSHIASIYDYIFHGFLNEGHEVIAQLLDRERPLRGKRVLEVGVGSGLTLAHLPRPIEYTGVDINEKMLQLATKKLKQLKLRDFKLELMNAERLHFKKDSFDFVIAASVLTAVKNPEHTMKEIIRVTKPGGKIAIVANIRKNGSRCSTLLKRVDPLTKKYLGFRMDLDSDYFKKFKSIRLLEKMEVNKIMGIPLSSLMVFDKI